MPVMLIVYDAHRDEAYWLYVQQYFEAVRVRIRQPGRTVSLMVPANNILNEDGIRQFARFRDNVLRQSQEVIRHHD